MENVLHTKLMVPRVPPSVVQRDELLRRLDGSLDRKLTLVTAPTGFGKTTLVSMWIANRDFAATWVTLDENDNDPARFWTYIVSALRTHSPALGRSTLSALNASVLPSVQTLLTPLINDLAGLDGPLALVLEDFHSINSKQIIEGISFLIQNMPESLYLIVISRTQPEISLPLMRARNELLEIDIADMRFNRQETESFLYAARIDISDSAISSLFQKTEGWIAGLQLAALSLNSRNAEQAQSFVSSFSGSHRYISDYLIREVFEAQPESIQNFLLKTCFLKNLTASLCDATAGTDSSAAFLDRLERDNVFVMRLERAGNQIWYRYNPLFAESIQFLARQRWAETDIQLLFDKAGHWYEYHGFLEDAIEMALQATLFERAMPLIEKYIEIHDLRELHTLNRWMEFIPRHDLLQRPQICFTFAQIILYSEDRFAAATALKIEPYLTAAESIWRSRDNQESLGRLLSFRGNVAWWQGNFEKAFDYARRSLPNLSESDIFWRGNSLLMLAYEALNQGRILHAQDMILEARALLGAAQNIFGVLASIQLLAEVFYQQGELDQAEQLNQQILTDAVGDESMLDDQGIASLSLSHISYERNDLEQAGLLANRALELGKQRANELLQVQSTIRLAYIAFAKDNSADAQELLKSAESRIQNPALLRELQNARVRLYIQLDDISTVDWWVKNISSDSRILTLKREQESFTLARLRIAAGRAREALDIIRPWKVDSAENGRVRSQVEELILEALARNVETDLSSAVKPLIEALTLAQAKGFRRIFLDEGPRMAKLLQAALATMPNRALSLVASTLLHSFRAAMTADVAATMSHIQIESLSQQELRVLRSLVAGLSNADIAQELVISNNTVKTHVKSIYRKLNVKSRNEAREVAHVLKLV
jgi:ATP/maltotriose-dependent transcriptional regulator MalT